MDGYYTKYYSIQSGGGYNIDGFGPLLKSQKIYQKGRGIGGFFSGIFRYLRPLLSSALQGLKNEALQTGADILNGKPINKIFYDRSIEVVDKLRDKAAEKIKQMSGAGCRTRKTIKGCLTSCFKQSKRGSRQVKAKKKKNIPINKSNKKRILDIFT